MLNWLKKIREDWKKDAERIRKLEEDQRNEIKAKMIRKQSLIEKFENLDRYSGSLDEYEQLRGKDYIILDTNLPKKSVTFYLKKEKWKDQDYDLIEILINQGCHGFIHYRNYCDYEKVSIGSRTGAVYSEEIPFMKEIGIP